MLVAFQAHSLLVLEASEAVCSSQVSSLALSLHLHAWPASLSDTSAFSTVAPAPPSANPFAMVLCLALLNLSCSEPLLPADDTGWVCRLPSLRGPSWAVCFICRLWGIVTILPGESRTLRAASLQDNIWLSTPPAVTTNGNSCLGEEILFLVATCPLAMLEGRGFASAGGTGLCKALWPGGARMVQDWALGG